MKQDKLLPTSKLFERIRNREYSMDELSDVAAELEKRYSEKRKAFKGLCNLCYILIAAFVTMGIMWYYADSRCINLSRENESLQKVDSLFRTFMVSDAESDSFSYKVSSNGLPISYRQLMKEVDSLRVRIDDIEYECEGYKIELRLIKKNYPIKIKSNSKKYWIEAPELDSAMLLLPVYRDKLRYDSEKDVWSIRY